MVISMLFLIFNLRHFCLKSDLSNALFCSACQICALISLALAQQDILKDLAREVTDVQLLKSGGLQYKGNVSSTAASKGETFNRSDLTEALPTNTNNPSEYDPFLMDDEPEYVGPEVLVDMEPPEEMVLSGTQPFHRKQPVKDGFTHDQKMILLELHNLYRSNVTPSSGNMNFMEWDEDLAVVAQLWANECVFEHGLPAVHNYPSSMGQNLYMGWDPMGERALFMWNEEYKYYDLEKMYCLPNKQCGHYTQMAWGDSRSVGCGMKRCGVRRFYVVCHYNPAGNIVGNRPYVVGKACSQCNTIDGGLCTNNLCVTKEQCSRNPNNCNAACNLECRNCGLLNTETCTCKCSDGWDSLDCSRLCVNSHEKCGKTPGWPSIATCSMNHHDVENIYCRKMCGKCRSIEKSASKRNLCCRGEQCKSGEVLDMERNLCQCTLLCPGPKCYYGPESCGSSKNTVAVLAVLVMQFIRFLTCS